MVIVLKTTDGQVGPLSFALTEEGEGTAALADGTYASRLHVTGDIFSKGTVTVTNNGTAFAFVSDGGNEFTGKIENNHFEFITGSILPDNEDGEALEFGSAKVPAEPSDGVQVIPAQSIELSYNDAAIPEPLTLNIDDTATLTAAILPTDADTQVWWSTDSPSVISIAPDGLSAVITAKKGGEAAVRVKTVKGGRTNECAVTVITPVVPGLYSEAGDILTFIEVSGQEGDSLLAKAFAYITSTTLTEENYRLIVGAAETTSTGYTLAKNITLTLQGTSEEAGVITKTGTGALFTIMASNTTDEPHLILDENITLQGNSSNNVALISIGNSDAAESQVRKGKLTMLEGSRITGNVSSGNNTGAGVYVLAKGTFILDGGCIDNNKTTAPTASRATGAGVRNGGTFTMNGGFIANNVTNGSGGGVWNGSSNSVFRMSGGIIYGTDGGDMANTASEAGGAALYSYNGVAGYGGAYAEAYGSGDLGVVETTLPPQE
jgi:hypothetical protein